MLEKREFQILYEFLKHGAKSQRELAAASGISLGSVCGLLKRLEAAGLLRDGALTDGGRAALAPYRVRNAVIMAAGMSSRFVPLSYERPKGLLRVKGEILIEREIRQLQEAGIRDITVVVGYMKEKFFYLEEKFGVAIVVNPDYAVCNNTSTLLRVADRLDNTYICSSDNYFVENVFEPYVYQAYYAAVYSPGKTDEYCLTTDRTGRITDVTIGGEAAWYMLGHVYFSQEFSKKFVEILRTEYQNRITREQLWENLYMRHIGELALYLKQYDADKVLEFDSLDELRSFDETYLQNADSRILQNIAGALGCAEQEIEQMTPIKEGLTNASFSFVCRGKKYVYRHPGVGTENYINRESEAYSMQVARELGLDDTFLYMDPRAGWKISRFIENAKTLDYHNEAQVRQALSMMRKLHDARLHSTFDFDIWRGALDFVAKIEKSGRTDFPDFPELAALMERVAADAEGDGVEKQLCHCDCYSPNFLADDSGKLTLIDWEYSGNDDPASDLGTFITCSDYTKEEALRTIALYLGHEPSKNELRHHLAYVAICSYYWFVWALYQDSVGKSTGEYEYIWYRNTRRYGEMAEALYREEA